MMDRLRQKQEVELLFLRQYRKILGEKLASLPLLFSFQDLDYSRSHYLGTEIQASMPSGVRSGRFPRQTLYGLKRQGPSLLFLLAFLKSLPSMSLRLQA